MSKISIIVPYHNTYEYLQRCVDSIKLTSTHEYEVIIIDNNSDINAQALFVDNPHIKYFRLSTNLGPGGARNLWRQYATGEYIAFCDSDDWVDYNFYDKIVSEMEIFDADVGIGGIMRNFAHKVSENPIKSKFDKVIKLESEMFFKIMTKEYSIGISIPPSSVNKVYRRKFLECCNISFLEDLFYEDLLFSTQVALNASCAVCVPDVYYHHYKRVGSITQSFSEKHILDFKIIFTHILDYLKTNCIYDKYKSCYYNFIEHFFNLIIRQLFEYERDEDKKKKFLKLAISSFNAVVDSDEYIEFLYSEQIRRHIQPHIENTIIN